MENLFRIIGYLILFAINAVMFWFLHSHFHFTILIIMIVAPVVSAVVNFIIRKKLGIQIVSGLDNFVKQGEENFFNIKVSNPTIFACLDARMLVEVENSFFGTSGSKRISIPIRGRRGFELTLPIIAEYPGILTVRVIEIKVKDLMGFFWLRRMLGDYAEVTVLPSLLTDVSGENVDLEQGMLESEESSKKGNDFSDVQEIREYIPGDKLMSIHWKLSAKRDILMVKDRVSMSDKQMAVLPELCNRNLYELNIILRTTYTLIMNLLSDKTTVRLMYWSADRYEYEDIRIDYKEELDQAFMKMFFEHTYANPEEAASHMAAVHPEMKAYLHISADSGKAVIRVRENG